MNLKFVSFKGWKFPFCFKKFAFHADTISSQFLTFQGSLLSYRNGYIYKYQNIKGSFYLISS
jgi:hypothetical protein